MTTSTRKNLDTSPCTNCGQFHNWRRGDIAMTLAWDPRDVERVQIIGTVRIQNWKRPGSERWMRMRDLATGKTLGTVTHNSMLCEVID